MGTTHFAEVMLRSCIESFVCLQFEYIVYFSILWIKISFYVKNRSCIYLKATVSNFVPEVWTITLTHSLPIQNARVMAKILTIILFINQYC